MKINGDATLIITNKVGENTIKEDGNDSRFSGNSRTVTSFSEVKQLTLNQLDDVQITPRTIK